MAKDFALVSLTKVVRLESTYKLAEHKESCIHVFILTHPYVVYLFNQQNSTDE